MRRWWVVLLGISMVGFVGAVYDARGTAPHSPAPAASTPAPAPDPAYSLAVIQSSGGAGRDDPLVGQFQHQLDVLSEKCQEPQGSLADYTVTIHNVLMQHSIQETYLSILTNVDQAVPAGIAPQKCDQIFAAWATLRIHTP